MESVVTVAAGRVVERGQGALSQRCGEVSFFRTVGSDRWAGADGPPSGAFGADGRPIPRSKNYQLGKQSLCL
jgi:hypothetical protein